MRSDFKCICSIVISCAFRQVAGVAYVDRSDWILKNLNPNIRNGMIVRSAPESEGPP